MFIFMPKTRDYVEYKITNGVTQEIDSTEHICSNSICSNSICSNSICSNSICKKINPIEKRLYPDDIIDKTGVIMESPYMNKTDIPGILIITGKTYGRVSKKVSNSRYYYKCIPNDKRLPCVLLPYQEKKQGFSKHKINLYVLFRLNLWRGKHPTGILNNVIGVVDDRVNYYEYELHCKNLSISIKKFTKEIDKATKKQKDPCYVTHSLDNSLEDRRDRYIFSIDPPETRDIDDAMGIITSNETPNTKTISIYIANVPYWLSMLELWEFISMRPSTVYLPRANINMLPKKLSENLISLIENNDRVAFVMDIEINTAENSIGNISFTTAKINVKKNFSYEEKLLLKCQDYKEILRITKALQAKPNNLQKYKYVEEIRDSHDVVEYYMIMMNHMCAERLYSHKCGIYRTVSTNTKTDADKTINQPNVDKELQKFINIWKYTSSRYSLYDEHTGHDIVAGGIDKYAQITSPIRRLCDIVNMAELQIRLGKLVETESMRQTIDKITDDIDNVNVLSKNVRKVQSSCKLLNYCLDMGEDNNVVEGYIIDIIEKSDIAEYSIYVPSLGLITKIKKQLQEENSYIEYNLYEKYKFGVCVFTDEHSFHKKIRLVFR